MDRELWLLGLATQLPTRLAILWGTAKKYIYRIDEAIIL